MPSLEEFKKDIAKLRELSEQAPSLALEAGKAHLLERYGKSLRPGRSGLEGTANEELTLGGLYARLVREAQPSSVYTPPALARELFQKTREVMPSQPALLDCSSGTGNLAAPFLEAGHAVHLMDTDEGALNLARLEYPGARILQEDFLRSGQIWDVIIGNPPWKGHKTMSLMEKKALKQRFPDVMDNKADLYYAFFQKGWEALREGGILSFIVSRYWLEAESAAGLRRFLLDHFRILYLHDWYGVRPFGAGVDPLLIILKKEGQTGQGQTNQGQTGQGQAGGVEEEAQSPAAPGDIEGMWQEAIRMGRGELREEQATAAKEPRPGSAEADLAQGAAPAADYPIPVRREDAGAFTIRRADLSQDSMKLLTGLESRLRQIIRGMAPRTLGDLGEFHQGIITGFDRAFIMDGQEAARLGIEGELLVPWAKSSDLARLGEPGSVDGLRRLIYADEGACHCPNFMAYIATHRERLATRREVRSGVREFYELQWGRQRALFEGRRILFPYKAPGSHFVIAQGIFHSADVYSYSTALDPEWITTLLNSPLYDAYIKTELKKLGRDLYEYYPHRLKNIRVPDPAQWPDAEVFLRALTKEVSA